MIKSYWAMIVLGACVQIFIASSAFADEPARKSNASDTAQFKAADAVAKAFTIPELEERILAARRSIKTAEMEIESDYTDQRGQRIAPFHIWLGTEGRVRSERKDGNDLYVVIYGDPFAFEYVRHPGQMENLDRAKRPGIMAMPMAELEGSKDPRFIFCNPLRLMLVPSVFTILHARKLDEIISASDRTQLESRNSTWNGEPSIIVSFYRPRTDNHFEYEVVPSQGFNIVRWRCQGDSVKNGGAYEVKISCELQHIADSTWFPRQINFEDQVRGAVRSTEKLSIKVLSMNRLIDDKTFGLAGLPPNLFVAFDAFARDPNKPRRPAMFWDGVEVRKFKPSDLHADEELMKKIE